MSKILVVYGSTYRETGRMANRIAEALMYAGHGVDVYQADQFPDGVPLAAYDCFLLASPVLRGNHMKCIRQFARRYAALLNHAPSAFVSVCREAASDPRRAGEFLDAFCRETGWYPKVVRSFTGAVADTRDRKLPWYLKLISRWLGLPANASRVWEFTDWDEVERFARSLASGWSGTDADVTLGRRRDATMSATHESGEMESNDQLFGGLSYRF